MSRLAGLFKSCFPPSIGKGSLQELRNNPAIAIENYDFYVDFSECKKKTSDINEGDPISNGGKSQEGGRCTISFSKVETSRVVRLKAEANNAGSDYYFPWLPKGVGYVDVPLGLPNGTIVVTGGMNGCGLSVKREPNALKFMHDADCKYLKPIEHGLLCRVDTSMYNGEKGKNLMLTNSAQVQALSYLFQLLIIKSSNQWHVVVSGLMITPKMVKLKGDLAVESEPVESFQPAENKVLATFKENEP